MSTRESTFLCRAVFSEAACLDRGGEISCETAACLVELKEMARESVVSMTTAFAKDEGSFHLMHRRMLDFKYTCP